MKTIFIYEQINGDPLSFFVLDGDYRHLDGIYVNGDKNWDDLSDLIVDAEGLEKITLLDKFPIDIVYQESDVCVITVGLIC